MTGYRREVLDGQAVISRRSGINVKDPEKFMPLLPLIARGMSNRLIAESISLTEGGVKTRLKALFDALGAADRAHAVAIGYNNGLLTRGAAVTEKFGELAVEREQTPEESLALGAALSAVMVEAGLTQAQLAKRLDRSAPFVNRMIYGKVYGSAKHVAAWLDACGVTGSKRQEILAMARPCQACGCRLQHVDSESSADDL